MILTCWICEDHDECPYQACHDQNHAENNELEECHESETQMEFEL